MLCYIRTNAIINPLQHKNLEELHAEANMNLYNKLNSKETQSVLTSALVNSEAVDNKSIHVPTNSNNESTNCGNNDREIVEYQNNELCLYEDSFNDFFTNCIQNSGFNLQNFLKNIPDEYKERIYNLFEILVNISNQIKYDDLLKNKNPNIEKTLECFFNLFAKICSNNLEDNSITSELNNCFDKGNCLQSAQDVSLLLNKNDIANVLDLLKPVIESVYCAMQNSPELARMFELIESQLD